ncbi:MAG: hypothetical protein ACPHJ3_06710, partial [Rubripirellula sp.]
DAVTSKVTRETRPRFPKQTAGAGTNRGCWHKPRVLAQTANPALSRAKHITCNHRSEDFQKI